MDLKKRAAEIVAESLAVKQAMGKEHFDILAQIARVMAAALKKHRRVYVMGNGGSAADAQHMAGELVGRFRAERKGLPAVSLATDTSVLTALANDFGFQSVFAKQIEALVVAGDIVVGISTSGNSANVIGGLAVARELDAVTVGLSGMTGGKMKKLCDLFYAAPSTDTPRIQECHNVAIHIICELVETLLTKS